MNQRTRSSSRRTVNVSRAADAQALRAAQGVSVPATMIDTLSERGVGLTTAFISTSGSSAWTHKSREQYIAEAAYLRAESRGFQPGHELEDWLAAEKALDAMFAAE